MVFGTGNYSRKVRRAAICRAYTDTQSTQPRFVIRDCFPTFQTLVPYLDPIVERLLKLLNPTGENAKQAKYYVQEQASTTLTMVADAREATFAKVIL
jgi:hypothetical protein